MRHLFIVAHPDDEILGAGAYIYDLIKQGEEVAVEIFNTCDITRYIDNYNQIVTDLKKSHEVLGIEKAYLHQYKDSNFHLANHRDMVIDIEEVLSDFTPDYVYTHHPADINQDHAVISQSCMEAFRIGQRCRYTTPPIKGLYMMEVQSSTEWGVNPAIEQFRPNTFVKVSQEGLEKKIESLKCYENVIREYPHPRCRENITALARYRGSQCGETLAESFQCVYRNGVD